MRKKNGNKVFEIQPDAAWDKGGAILSLLDEMSWGVKRPSPSPSATT